MTVVGSQRLTQTPVSLNPRMSQKTPVSSGWDGYGDEWEDIREKTLRRDNYRCQRCFENRGPLQAHHIVPKSDGGPDTLDNLVTLCRPCHGVQHPQNDTFDDSRPDATLFPDTDAPGDVARMRNPEDKVCERCREEFDHLELIAYGSRGDYLTICKPCVGVVGADADVPLDVNELRSNDRFRMDNLRGRRTETSVRPSIFADSSVSARREPVNTKEEYIDDTVLRFFLGGWLNVAATVVVLYLLFQFLTG